MPFAKVTHCDLEGIICFSFVHPKILYFFKCHIQMAQGRQLIYIVAAFWWIHWVKNENPTAIHIRTSYLSQFHLSPQCPPLALSDQQLTRWDGFTPTSENQHIKTWKPSWGLSSITCTDSLLNSLIIQVSKCYTYTLSKLFQIYGLGLRCRHFIRAFEWIWKGPLGRLCLPQGFKASWVNS